MKLAEEKKSSGSSSSKLYVATNQTRQNLLQVRGCLLKRCMHCMHTCIASTICIQDYVHPKRKRFFCALPYVRAYTLCVQMHKHKCIHGSRLFANRAMQFLLRIWLWQWDSGFRLLPKRTNHHHSEMHSLTQILWQTHTRTHEMNAHLCARGPLSLSMCAFKFRIRYQRTGVRKTFQSAIVRLSYLSSNIERNRRKKRYVLDIQYTHLHAHARVLISILRSASRVWLCKCIALMLVGYVFVCLRTDLWQWLKTRMDFICFALNRIFFNSYTLISHRIHLYKHVYMFRFSSMHSL